MDPTSVHRPLKGKLLLTPKLAGKLQKSLNKVRFIAAMKALSKATATDFEPRERTRFLFNDKGLKMGESLTEQIKDKMKRPEDFYDVVDQDDRRVEYVVSQILVEHLIDSFTFKCFIFTLIIANSVFIGLQTNESLAENYRIPFSIFDEFVLAVFVIEMLLKWYYGFWMFWTVGWNVFDFVIVLVLLIVPQFTFVGSARILRILRLLRTYRGVKSVGALAGLSVVLQTLILSIPDMVNITLLLFIIVLGFGVVGVTLFGAAFPDNFDTLADSMFTQFIIITEDGWNGIYEQMQPYSITMQLLAAAYFFLSILIGGLVFSNLIVAVFVTNLEACMTENEQVDDNDKQGDETESGSVLSEDASTGKTHVRTLNDIKVHCKPDFDMQVPMEGVRGLNKLSMQSLEKYLTILSLLEQNLVEYLSIKSDLSNLFQVVQRLNTKEEQFGSKQSVQTTESKQKPQVPADTLTRGDILSNIIELQERGAFPMRSDSQTMADFIKSYRGHQA